MSAYVVRSDPSTNSGENGPKLVGNVERLETYQQKQYSIVAAVAAMLLNHFIMNTELIRTEVC